MPTICDTFFLFLFSFFVFVPQIALIAQPSGEWSRLGVPIESRQSCAQLSTTSRLSLIAALQRGERFANYWLIELAGSLSRAQGRFFKAALLFT